MTKPALKPAPVVLPQPPLNLRAIYLRESSTSFDPTFDPLTPNQQLHVLFKCQPHSYSVTGEITADDPGRIPGSYTFLTEFETAYFLAASGPPSDPLTFETTGAVARIKAQFAADYLVIPGAPVLSDVEAQSWGGSAALMHTWTYWREYCHSTMLRLNMPVVMVPMMVLQPVVQSQVAPTEAINPPVRLKPKPKPRKVAQKK